MGLTLKQEMFCQYYIQCGGNGAEAARRAGYSRLAAKQIASDLLTLTDVIAHIQELKEKNFNKYDVSAERIIAEYSKLAFFDPQKMYDDEGNLLNVNEMDSDTAAAISGVETDIDLKANKETDKLQWEKTRTKTVKVKTLQKAASLEGLARITGLISGETKITLNMNAPGDFAGIIIAHTVEDAIKILEAEVKLKGGKDGTVAH